MTARIPLRRARRHPTAHPIASPAALDARATAAREDLADEIVVVILALTALAGLFTWTRHLAAF